MRNKDPLSRLEHIELLTTRQVLPTGLKPAWLLSEAARPAFYSGELFCLTHHWEDPDKKASDYRFLADLHARVLTGLSESLNALHGVERSNKSWDVLIGYWLMRALSCLLDLWETVRHAAESGHSFTLLFSSLNERNITPMNTSEAINWFHADWWNEAILLLIARQFAVLKAVQTKPACAAVDHGTPVQLSIRNSLTGWRNVAGGIVRRSAKTSRADLFLIQTGLPQNLIHGITEVGGDRVARPHFPTLLRYPNGKSSRTWRPEWSGIGSDFERWLQTALPEILPTAYVENFSYLDRRYARPVPENPFTVITKTAHFRNEGFKFWFSRHGDETGCLAVIQHGGGPLFEMNGAQRWEKNLSDKYLTTGLNDEVPDEKIRPVGRLENNLSGEWSRTGYALLVSNLLPRHNSDVRAMPVASQLPLFFDDQADLVNALPAEIQERLRVRLYPKGDYGWDQRSQWLKRAPGVVFDSEKQTFQQAVAGSRIVIVPYRGSTYGQTLHANIPTIIFFSSLWPVEDSSRPFFSMLSEVGIFHSNAVTAAQKIVEVWPDVAKWWFSVPVQEAVRAWNARYAGTYEDPAARILEQVGFSEAPEQPVSR